MRFTGWFTCPSSFVRLSYYLGRRTIPLEKTRHFPEYSVAAAVLCWCMKVKKLLNGILGHHMMRHRQHRRFLHNIAMQARHFGPGRGLLVLGAMALGGYFMQRRHASHVQAQAHLPEVGANY